MKRRLGRAAGRSARRWWSISACAIVLMALLAGRADAAETAWRALPWHLVDYHHKFPPTGAFRSVAIDMTLRGRVGADASLYVSPVWGKLGGTGFYFGLVSQLSGRQGRGLVGKGLLFSRWGSGTADDIRVPDAGWSYRGDKRTSGEGDYISVRQAFAWGEGRYSFALSARPEKAATWVNLSVTDRRTGRRIDGGGLRFPGAGLTLERTLVSFVEIFPPHGKGKWAIPKSLPRLDVAFSPAVVNGAFGPVSHRVHFPKRVPRLVKIHDDGFDFHVGLGHIPVPSSGPVPTAANDNAGKSAKVGSQ